MNTGYLLSKLQVITYINLSSIPHVLLQSILSSINQCTCIPDSLTDLSDELEFKLVNDTRQNTNSIGISSCKFTISMTKATQAVIMYCFRFAKEGAMHYHKEQFQEEETLLGWLISTQHCNKMPSLLGSSGYIMTLKAFIDSGSLCLPLISFFLVPCGS